MQSRSITYFSEGNVVVGDLFTPDDLPAGKHPAIVLVTGFGGIRSIGMAEFAEIFTGAGYIALTLDFRGWGDSGGERGRFAPLEQVDDIRNAVTWLECQEFVDPERIGAWGVSFGGLTAPYAAATDPRIKATVGMIGVAHGYQAMTNNRTPEEMKELEVKVTEARRQKVLTNEAPREVSVLTIFRDEQGVETLTQMWDAFPAFRNFMSYDSVGRVFDFRPIDIIHRISPRPIAFIAAEKDTVGSPDSYHELFEAAQEPKEWYSYPCGHFEMNAPGPHMDQAFKDILGFFDRYL